MNAGKNRENGKQACCLDETGRKLAFHLCCPACRRQMAELERTSLVAAGLVPVGCSSAIVDALARGPVVEYREGYWKEVDGKPAWVALPYRSGCAARVRDVFDVMADQAARRGGNVPFTAAQVGAGRDYRALHERVASAGVKCSRAFHVELAGAGGGDFMDAWLADVERLRRFERAIGDGMALSVRRAAAHAMDRGQRKSISDRALVDAVCIAEQPLSRVLKTHGWAAKGKNRQYLRLALGAALDRMRGV